LDNCSFIETCFSRRFHEETRCRPFAPRRRFRKSPAHQRP
jgi:hypothetical protein